MLDETAPVEIDAIYLAKGIRRGLIERFLSEPPTGDAPDPMP